MKSNWIKMWFRNYKSHLIIIGLYAVVVFVTGWQLDLSNSRDRAWFNAILAIGVIVFVFIEFSLDFINRRREFLHKKKVEATLEFTGLMRELSRSSKNFSELINILEIVKKMTLSRDMEELAVDKMYKMSTDLEEASSRLSQFCSSEKMWFIYDILKRYGKNEVEEFDRTRNLIYLTNKIYALGLSDLSKTEEEKFQLFELELLF